MTINARKLKESEKPERTQLYEVRNSCEIIVEEKQRDRSLDRVILEYSIKENDIGYFANEYRPENVPKEGAKVVDITALILNHADRCVRWHLYDIKDSLAGENTVVKLCNQWNAGLQYLQKNIMDHVAGYSKFPSLGVITRCYDEERMVRLRDVYQKQCNEIENSAGNLSLLQRKNRTSIGKYRACLKAAQAILDKRFQAANETDTYMINIKILCCKDDNIYMMKFPV